MILYGCSCVPVSMVVVVFLYFHGCSGVPVSMVVVGVPVFQ